MVVLSTIVVAITGHVVGPRKVTFGAGQMEPGPKPHLCGDLQLTIPIARR